MIVEADPAAFFTQARRWRQSGERLSFVPTMGALHEGHLSLVRRARLAGTKIIASIFVNPTQFGPKDDFSAYPRTLAADLGLLEKEGVDAVFTPASEAIYPEGNVATVHAGALAEGLCGAFRPGHFDGVCTVVVKLVNIVACDSMVLGEKDFQQLQVLRHCFRSLFIPVDIVGAETVREPDGLAMSSRNRGLSMENRERASEIFKALNVARELARSGETGCLTIEKRTLDRLTRAGFRVQYATIVDPVTLARKETVSRGDRLCIAAFLDTVRLIDNLELV
jgi:pantoate--beta-alanine ligase